MKILICPKCKSNKISYAAGALTGQYYCGKCGYYGSLVIEEEIDVSKYKEE